MLGRAQLSIHPQDMLALYLETKLALKPWQENSPPWQPRCGDPLPSPAPTSLGGTQLCPLISQPSRPKLLQGGRRRDRRDSAWEPLEK